MNPPVLAVVAVVVVVAVNDQSSPGLLDKNGWWLWKGLHALDAGIPGSPVGRVGLVSILVLTVGIRSTCM